GACGIPSQSLGSGGRAQAPPRRVAMRSRRRGMRGRMTTEGRGQGSRRSRGAVATFVAGALVAAGLLARGATTPVAARSDALHRSTARTGATSQAPLDPAPSPAARPAQTPGGQDGTPPAQVPPTPAPTPAGTAAPLEGAR